MLKEGDTIPHVRVLDDTGASVDTGGLLGQTLILYFYPKDDTPG